MNCDYQLTGKENDKFRYTCKTCGHTRLSRHADPTIFVRRCQSRGLGDTIARLTRRFGIKPCGGCKKRQASLNKLWPYR